MFYFTSSKFTSCKWGRLGLSTPSCQHIYTVWCRYSPESSCVSSQGLIALFSPATTKPRMFRASLLQQQVVSRGAGIIEYFSRRLLLIHVWNGLKYRHAHKDSCNGTINLQPLFMNLKRKVSPGVFLVHHSLAACIRLILHLHQRGEKFWNMVSISLSCLTV